MIQHTCKCAFVGYNVSTQYYSIQRYGTQSGLPLFTAMGTGEMGFLPQLPNSCKIILHMYQNKCRSMFEGQRL